jgi:hypothetical protein
MDVDIPKCAITGCPNKSKTNPQIFKALFQAQNTSYRNTPIPALHQYEPYLYLGIHLIPSLKWNIQLYITTTKLMNQCKQLLTCLVILKQKITMVDIVIRVGIAYSFYAVPYSMPTIFKLDKKIIFLQKKICGLPNCIPNISTQLPHNLFGMEAFSIKNAYLQCIGKQLLHILNDTFRLGIIYRGLIQYILAKHGIALNIPRIKPHNCICSPTTRTLYLLKNTAGIHLQSTISTFRLLTTLLETAWMASTIQHPYINPQLSHKLLNKLLHHITTLAHLTLPDRLHLMTSQDFKIYHVPPTRLINQALHIDA